MMQQKHHMQDFTPVLHYHQSKRVTLLYNIKTQHDYDAWTYK